MSGQSVRNAGLPVRSDGLLATNIPDIQLETFMVQGFNVKALHCELVKCRTDYFARGKPTLCHCQSPPT